MPLLSLHLLQLRSKTTAENYVQRLLSTEPSVEVVVASKPRYLVIRPTKQDVTHLADTSYDLMILARAPNETLPESLRSDIQREYKVVVGIPSKLLSSYPQRNRKLLAESSSAGLTGSLDSPIVPESSQNLELSPQLLEFMKKMEHRPVTMLNLLHFNSGGKPSYYQYGQVRLLPSLYGRPRPDKGRTSSRWLAKGVAMLRLWATWLHHLPPTVILMPSRRQRTHGRR